MFSVFGATETYCELNDIFECKNYVRDQNLRILASN